MTTVVISQPMYFPWPGFLAQMALADVMVWLTDAQFSKGSYTNRVQVRLPSGISWLSIPLEGKGSKTMIADLAPAREDWHAAHMDTLRQSLKDAPHADAALDLASGIDRSGSLCDAVISSSERLADACGITPPETRLSTEMDVPGSGSTRVLGMVKALGGTRYITGHGARGYLDHAAFDAAGVAVDYMDYDVRPWRDDPGFTPFVTGLDLLASVGGAAARDYLNPRTRPWTDFLSG